MRAREEKQAHSRTPCAHMWSTLPAQNPTPILELYTIKNKQIDAGKECTYLSFWCFLSFQRRATKAWLHVVIVDARVEENYAEPDFTDSKY